MEASSLIREARRRHGITQQELARRARTSQAAVARYETGKSDPRASTLRRLLEACGEQVSATSVDVMWALPRKGPIGKAVERHRNGIRASGRAISDEPVRIFGSVARGEDTAESDLDLLVELREGENVLAVYELQETLEALLGVRVDVLSTRAASPEVLEAAMRDAVVV